MGAAAVAIRNVFRAAPDASLLPRSFPSWKTEALSHHHCRLDNVPVVRVFAYLVVGVCYHFCIYTDRPIKFLNKFYHLCVCVFARIRVCSA